MSYMYVLCVCFVACKAAGFICTVVIGGVSRPYSVSIVFGPQWAYWA